MPATPKYAYGISTDTRAGPSPSIWAGCPVLAMIEDPGVGAYYFEDFTGPDIDVTTTNGYTITQFTGGGTGEISHADSLGGALLVDSAGNTSDDDGVTVHAGAECWAPAVNKTLWFEARVQFSDMETEPDQFLVGLTDTDTAPIGSGAIATTGENHLAFFTDAGTTVKTLEFSCAKAGVVSMDTDIAGAVAEDDTWIKLGYIVDSHGGDMRVHLFINGLEIKTAVITKQTAIPTTEMVLTYVAQVEQTGAHAEMLVDWVRIAQLR